MPDFLFGLSGKLPCWLVEGRSLSSREQTCPLCVAGAWVRGWQPLPARVLDLLDAPVYLWLLICGAEGTCVVVISDVCPCKSSSANRAVEPWAVCPNILSQTSCCQGSVALWYRRTVPCCMTLADWWLSPCPWATQALVATGNNSQPWKK